MNSTGCKKINFGQFGQGCVEQLLADQGYSILTRNFNVRVGEIDIVAQKDEVVCFVEVKTRSKKFFPINMVVNYSKQSKMEKAAKTYIARTGATGKVFRFDVATVLIDGQKKPEINYLKNAFFAQSN